MADVARHVIGCDLTQARSVCSALDDVASSACQTRRAGTQQDEEGAGEEAAGDAGARGGARKKPASKHLNRKP